MSGMNGHDMDRWERAYGGGPDDDAPDGPVYGDWGPAPAGSPRCPCCGGFTDEVEGFYFCPTCEVKWDGLADMERTREALEGCNERQ